MCPQRVGSPLTPSRSGCQIQCPQVQATSRGLRCGLRFLSPVLEVTQWVPSLHLLQGQSHKLVVGSQMIPTECEQCWQDPHATRQRLPAAAHNVSGQLRAETAFKPLWEDDKPTSPFLGVLSLPQTRQLLKTKGKVGRHTLVFLEEGSFLRFFRGCTRPRRAAGTGRDAGPQA